MLSLANVMQYLLKYILQNIIFLWYYLDHTRTFTCGRVAWWEVSTGDLQWWMYIGNHASHRVDLLQATIQRGLPTGVLKIKNSFNFLYACCKSCAIIFETFLHLYQYFDNLMWIVLEQVWTDRLSWQCQNLRDLVTSTPPFPIGSYFYVQCFGRFWGLTN